MVRTLLIALALVTLTSRPAAAEGVTLVGGPVADRDAQIASIEQVRALMTVCWQRKPPATVKINLAVAASGEVTKATATTKGPSAQCAAGVLAVSTLAASARAWKGTVVLASVGEGKAADVRAIHDQLATHGFAFFDCQRKEPAFIGKLLLRVTVRQDGAIRDAAATVKEGTDGQEVAACVAAAAGKLTLAPIISASVTYELALSYAGGPAGGAADAPDPSLQPSKKGPHLASDLVAVIKGKKAALQRCTKGSRARGKVTVRLEIGANGKVMKASIKASEIDSTVIEDCLLVAFRAMTFPTADGKTVVHYPLKLDSGAIRLGGS